MGRVDIKDVTEENAGDLARVCVPSHRLHDPDFVEGMEEKKKWSLEMLAKWGPFARLAYGDGAPVGMIQYRPVPDERVITIDCIYVPPGSWLCRGVGSLLFASLIEYVNKPMAWFDNRPPLALVVNTFEGGGHDQYTARQFFTGKGFKKIGEDPDYLYYAFQAGFVYRPPDKKDAGYIPQDDDKAKVLIIRGPNGCPFTYPSFSRRMERYIGEIAPEVPIRWIDSSDEPEELAKRNVRVGDCIVNARPVRSFVLDKKAFQKEVRELLKNERALS